MSEIRAHHALTEQEAIFCKVYVAFGSKNQAEAYRRGFLVRTRQDRKGKQRWIYVERPDRASYSHDDLKDLKEINSKEVSRRAQLLLEQEHIQQGIKEIKGDAGDTARQVLEEQAKFGDGRDARAAAEKILDLEDKMGFRDASERWAEIMCAIGTEVVVPLPGGGEVSFPLREMFPRYEEALPPAEVLQKTEKCLHDYRASLATKSVTGEG